MSMAKRSIGEFGDYRIDVRGFICLRRAPFDDSALGGLEMRWRWMTVGSQVSDAPDHSPPFISGRLAAGFKLLQSFPLGGFSLYTSERMVSSAVCLAIPTGAKPYSLDVFRKDGHGIVVGSFNVTCHLNHRGSFTASEQLEKSLDQNMEPRRKIVSFVNSLPKDTLEGPTCDLSTSR